MEIMVVTVIAVVVGLKMVRPVPVTTRVMHAEVLFILSEVQEHRHRFISVPVIKSKLRI